MVRFRGFAALFLALFTSSLFELATSMPGLILIGGMSDKLDLRVSICLSTVGSALAIFLVWGFTAKLAPLLVFACIYGFFSGG